MEGTQIGTYRIERTLGRGGFGVVYIGVDTRLGRRAAIKQLLPELSNNREIVERFFNEAKAAANINHPGIVEIYDVGWHTDGSAYFAMKLLDGDSLAKRLRSGALSIPLAATIARQVSSALIAAHARGIVHRDLKPDNIILVPDDEVAIGERAVVLDFGIAKLGGAEGMSHTRSGMMMGTPGYMSPEQCRGAGEVDHRTDLYALGCILFEMLTGRIPFVGEGPGEVMGMHQFVEPPLLRSLRTDAPPELEALVSRLLAKKVDQRLQLMTEVQTALQVFATGGRSREQPATAPSASTPMPVSTSVNPIAATAVSEREQPSPRSPDAISEAARAANIPPRTMDPPTQPSTFSAARGELAPEKKSSKKGLAIGIGVVAVAGMGIAIALAGRSKPDPVVTPAPPDAGLVAIADAPDVVVKTVDAAPIGAPTDAIAAQLARCREIQLAKNWLELVKCALEVDKLDPTQAKRLRDLAISEQKSELALRDITDAHRRKDQEGVYAAYARIPSDSAYRAEARVLFDVMGKDFVATIERQSKALAAKSDCKKLDEQLKTLREQERKYAGKPHHYLEAIAVAREHPCPSASVGLTTATVPLDKLPAGFSCAPGTPDKANGRCNCPASYTPKRDAQAFATCAKKTGNAVPPPRTCDPACSADEQCEGTRCVKRATPPPTSICADPAVVDDVEKKGDAALMNGSFAQALQNFELILKCKNVLHKAYLAACRARNFAKAKIYFTRLGKESLAQVCMKDGFDPRKP